MSNNLPNNNNYNQSAKSEEDSLIISMLILNKKIYFLMINVSIPLYKNFEFKIYRYSQDILN